MRSWCVFPHTFFFFSCVQNKELFPSSVSGFGVSSELPDTLQLPLPSFPTPDSSLLVYLDGSNNLFFSLLFWPSSPLFSKRNSFCALFIFFFSVFINLHAPRGTLDLRASALRQKVHRRL